MCDGVVLQGNECRGSTLLFYCPHNSNPRPANAAALLKQEEAATSAAGAWELDSSGSDATAE